MLNTRIAGLALASLSLIGLSAVSPAAAQTTALSYATPAASSLYGGPYAEGFRFTTSAPILVTSLGYNKGLLQTSNVYLFIDSTQTQLASTSVSTADTLSDNFYYHTLATSILLSPGVTYLVAADQYAGVDFYPGTRTADPTITFVGNRVADTNYAQFVYPNRDESANIATTNFQFTAAAVPEASASLSFGLLLVGAGGLMIKARRRKSAPSTGA